MILIFGGCITITNYRWKHARQAHDYEGRRDEAKKKYHGHTSACANAYAAAEGGAVCALPRRSVHLRRYSNIVHQQAAVYKRRDATIRESSRCYWASCFVVVALHHVRILYACRAHQIISRHPVAPECHARLTRTQEVGRAFLFAAEARLCAVAGRKGSKRSSGRTWRGLPSVALNV